MSSSIAIFYAPILESVARSQRGLTSEAIRQATVEALGTALTESERRRVITRGWQTSKGNYFEWALADLVTYKFLGKSANYCITPKGQALLEHLHKNPLLQLDRGFLAGFPFPNRSPS